MNMKRLFVSIMVVMTAMGMMATDYGGRHVDRGVSHDGLGFVCMLAILIVFGIIWIGAKK